MVFSLIQTLIATDSNYLMTRIQHNKKNVDVAYQSGTARSVLDCVRLCVHEIGCGSVNYKDNECELLEELDERVSFDYVFNVEGWQYVCRFHFS